MPSRRSLLLGGLAFAIEGLAFGRAWAAPAAAVYPLFPSKLIKPRQVTVWLPEGYDPAVPLPVLYMHDGQNVFDPARAYGGVTWGVAEKKSQAIVVAIDNGGELRGREFLPRKIWDHLPAKTRARMAKNWGGEPLSDEYLAFLVTELKPFIDKTYVTLSDAAHTSIMGSSMGGLISFYAQGEYPEVFGASASLSMHWPMDNPWLEAIDHAANAPEVIAAFDAYLPEAKVDPQTARLYMDQGTAGLDGTYRPYSLGVEAVMAKRGWVRPHLVAQIFPGEDHNEAAWARRLDVPLDFLLRAKSVASGTLITWPQFASANVIPRDVKVWLPDGYDPSVKHRVVYMMDGQNLFTPSEYSGADWGVAEVLPKLIREGKVPPAIVVGVDNIPARTREYMPQRVYELMAPDYQARVQAFEDNQPPGSDAFLRFLVGELKPFIDKTYTTVTGSEGTSIMGSSMGAHISLYAQGQYPQVFGASASVSMPWLMASPTETPEAIAADAATVAAGWGLWLKETQMVPGRNRIYSDQGTVGLDGLFTPYEQAVTAVFRAQGWDEASYRPVIYEGTEHSEKDWRKRLDVPMRFVLAR